ncbi:Zinc finger protein 668 [Heterocephalus glaber]|uniref:Zinc finger protein 668 n=1 Tax=Heterocephalus glaber TaxID=10181 RepID=G5AJW0_HETGA|nr:Zinc finger protein 668 [Heterocephalus glaber]
MCLQTRAEEVADVKPKQGTEAKGEKASGDKGSGSAAKPRPYTRPLCLRVHLASQAGELPFWCVHCPEAYGALSKLKIHQRGHTGAVSSETRQDKAYMEELFKELWNQELSRTGERPFLCSSAGTASPAHGLSPANLASSWRRKPSRCLACSKGFPQLSSYQSREFTHALRGEALPVLALRPQVPRPVQLRAPASRAQALKQYCCDKCGKDFPHPADLAMH